MYALSLLLSTLIIKSTKKLLLFSKTPSSKTTTTTTTTTVVARDESYAEITSFFLCAFVCVDRDRRRDFGERIFRDFEIRGNFCALIKGRSPSLTTNEI